MSENDGMYEVGPRSWLDAFPWLKGAAGRNSKSWWDHPIDNDSAVRGRRLATISELAMERLTNWTIGEIFPGLPSQLEMNRLPLPVRAINALAREGHQTVGDLSGLTVRKILAWRNVGVGTVDAILEALADVSTSSATTRVIAGHLGQEEPEFSQEYHQPAAENTASIITDLTCIAKWYVTAGLDEQTLLDGAVSPGTPGDVLEALARLKVIRARDVLQDKEQDLNVAALFDHALSSLDSRATEILRFRIFSDNPKTLEEMGLQNGVTRERIRQIEGKARGVMLSAIAGNGPLALFAEAVRSCIGSIRPLDDLLMLFPALGQRVETVGQPAWRVLDRLDDAYEIEKGWCAVPSMTAAQSMTQTQLQEQADEYGIVPLEDLSLIDAADVDHRKELTASWLRQNGYILDGEHVLTRTQSVGDYAAAVLSLTGGPLTAEQIVERFAFERSPRSLRNAMNLDERFARVDRDQFALAEWGMEKYSGIRSLIREQVARSGGRTKLNDLIEFITGRYSVSAASVVAYASAPPFESREGIVRFVGNTRRIRKTPKQTRRLYRHRDSWVYRVRITQDHLRGSGSVAPVAIATILGLQFGQSRELESPMGTLTVSWTGTQPSFGTIRRFLMAYDIASGSEVFLVLYDDGVFSFEPAREPTGDPALDALSMIGAPIIDDPETARVTFASAVGLSAAAPVPSIIGAYRERGDEDVADLLTGVRGYLEGGHETTQPRSTTDVDEILDLL